jgi:hypothetical protein
VASLSTPQFNANPILTVTESGVICWSVAHERVFAQWSAADIWPNSESIAKSGDPPEMSI